MGRKKNIFNTPEYRHIEENLDEILEELNEEGDEKEQLELPEDWDREFRKIIEGSAKKRRTGRHLKTAVAAVVLLSGISLACLGTNNAVQGDGIMELFEKKLSVGNRVYIESSTEESTDFLEHSSEEIVFYASSMEELNEEIYQEIKRPFFRVGWIPENFNIENAIYNRDFGTINIELSYDEKKIYICEQEVFSESSTIFVIEESKRSTVKNRSLNMNIEIYESIYDGNLIFYMIYKNCRFDFNSNITLKECEKIAENITFE